MRHLITLHVVRRLVRHIAVAMAAATGAGLAMANPGLYVSTQGVDTANGLTPTASLRTLTKALQIAAGQPLRIQVTTGRFDEGRLTLAAGQSISGGWDLGFAKQTLFSSRQLNGLSSADGLCGPHTCVAAADADRTISAAGTDTALQQLVVLGPDRSSVPGSDSLAVVARDGHLLLEGVVIAAGRGGRGSDGHSGGAGTGYCSRGGQGGWVKNTQSGVFSPVCEPIDGTQGDPVPAGGRTANGGAGGKPGDSNCSAWPTAANSRLEDGKPGGRGDDGTEGPPGASSASDAGRLVRGQNGELRWASAVVVGPGHSGSAGAGGGGGGPGGSWNVVYWCLIGYPIAGGQGHTGDPGGCGGGGGTGGASGGGAFSLLLDNSLATMTDVAVIGGVGGEGGTGGNGSAGGPGLASKAMGSGGQVTSGCSSNTTTAGTGGEAGPGGKGGGGGGAAGGNGGPAFTVVTTNGGKLELAGGAQHIVGGQAGGAGAGGRGADSSILAPSGNPGQEAEMKALDLAK